MNAMMPETDLTRGAHPIGARWINLLVQRQLEDINSGNGAYLDTFLKAAKAAGLSVRVIFAPWHAFGNRPWAQIHPRLLEKIDDVVWQDTTQIGARYVSLSPRVWVRFAARLMREAQKRLGFDFMVKTYLGKPLGRGELNRVVRAANARPADLTMAEYSSMAPVLQHLSYATQRSCLMHDLLSDRALRFRAAGIPIDFTEIAFEREIDWLKSCDALVFASANEMQKVMAHLPKARAAWLRPDAPDYKTGDANGPVRVVFIGTTHAGNAVSLDHFIDEIWPIVHRLKPELSFEIAGSIGKHLTPERMSAPGVRVLGRVEDLSSIGGANAIGVAPTKLATGVSIKIAEYLLLGMNCVAYPLALEGFGDTLDDLIMEADTPEAFAQAIVNLADDSALRLRMASTSADEARRRLANNDVIDLLAASPAQTRPAK